MKAKAERVKCKGTRWCDCAERNRQLARKDATRAAEIRHEEAVEALIVYLRRHNPAGNTQHEESELLAADDAQ